MHSPGAIRASDAPVQSHIEFLVPRPGRLFTYNAEPAPHEPPATAVFEVRAVVIHNARSADTSLSVDTNGAALLRRPTAVRNFYDNDEVQRHYYPESAQIIGSAVGASRVLVFDHNVRQGAAAPVNAEQTAPGRPVVHAHTDFTESSARRRLLECLAGESFDFDGRRFMQINLWRPIRAPLRDWPLAICDGATLSHGALGTVELIYPERRGEIYYLSYDASQRWLYAPDMGTDEIWLIKNFDSRTQDIARYAPHSAFDDPTAFDEALPRESIEVRAFALFD